MSVERPDASEKTMNITSQSRRSYTPSKRRAPFALAVSFQYVDLLSDTAIPYPSRYICDTCEESIEMSVEGHGRHRRGRPGVRREKLVASAALGEAVPDTPAGRLRAP